jgi:hypothetical protein
MTSRPPVPTELVGILGVAQRMALELMQRHRGHFYPFAVVTTPAGQIQPVVGVTGVEKPTSAEIMEALETDLRAGVAAGRVRSLALGSEQYVPIGRDKRQRSLVIELEARDGDALYFVQPVSTNLLGRPTLGEVRIRTLEPRFFIGTSEASGSPSKVE